MKNLQKILSTFLVMCTVFAFGFTNSAQADSVYGNSNSNINNGGIAASKGNYSYSRSSATYKKADEDYYYIYRTYKNGTSKKKIVNNAAEEPYINVVGNYIYYVGVYNSGEDLGIYRVKTDGTGKKRLISNCEDDPIIVKDNYLYYTKERDRYDDDVVSLYRYDLNKLKNAPTLYTTSRDIQHMSLSGNYIYITAEGDSNTIIYRINTNTKSRKSLYSYKHRDDSEIEDMIYYKSNIYYVISDDNNNSKIYKMTSTGSNRNLLTKYYTEGINIYSDKIYYINSSGSLCSMSLNGSNRKTIKKTADNKLKYNINITKSRIYFGEITFGNYWDDDDDDDDDWDDDDDDDWDDDDDDDYYVISNNIYRMTLSGGSLNKM